MASGPNQWEEKPEGENNDAPRRGEAFGGHDRGVPVKTSGMAIASMVCAFLCQPAGLVMGIIAINQMRQLNCIGQSPYSGLSNPPPWDSGIDEGRWRPVG